MRCRETLLIRGFEFLRKRQGFRWSIIVQRLRTLAWCYLCVNLVRILPLDTRQVLNLWCIPLPAMFWRHKSMVAFGSGSAYVMFSLSRELNDLANLVLQLEFRSES